MEGQEYAPCFSTETKQTKAENYSNKAKFVFLHKLVRDLAYDLRSLRTKSVERMRIRKVQPTHALRATAALQRFAPIARGALFNIVQHLFR